MAGHTGHIAKNTLKPAGEGTTHRHLFHAFLILLLWVPLPLGSNRPWSWGMMEVWICTLLAVWAGMHLIHRTPHAHIWSPNATLPAHRSAILLLFLGTAYPLWQTIPWSETMLAFISPMTLTLRQLSGGTTLAGPISLDLHATWVEWLKGTAYLGAFWLTLVLTPTRTHLKQLAWVILGSGAIQVGLVLATMDPTLVRDVKGTFVNRNHLAGLLELILPVAIGFLVHGRKKRSEEQSWRDTLYGWLAFISGAKGIMAGLGVVMFLTLFLTQSRSGNASLLASLLVMAGLSRLRRHRQHHTTQHKAPTPRTRKRSRTTKKPNRIWGRFFVRSLLLTTFLLVGSWVGLGHLMGRYMQTDVHQEERWVVSTTTLGLIRDYPLFGSGSGTFAFIYPRYQNAALSNVFYDHAHNDHLELLADRGIVGYGLLALGISLCWLGMARAYLRRRDPLACALLFASLTATLSLTIHGIIDFNFQIPANALYFMVLLAMGLRSTTLGAPGNRTTTR